MSDKPWKDVKYPMTGAWIQYPDIPENPFEIVAAKVGVKVAETIDDMIMHAIVEEAKKEGINYLYLLDKTFITNALKHEFERWKAENGEV